MTMTAVRTKVPKPALSKKPSTVVCARVAPNEPLTLFDRCDCSAVAGDKNGRARLGCCSAQALVRVTLVTGGQILFCGHHYNRHGPKITGVAVVHNEREQGEVGQPESTTRSGRAPLVPAS
jgi:hypothetical protein